MVSLLGDRPVTLFNKLSLTLIALVVVMLSVFWIGLRPVEAGVYQTPAGGWGIDRPAPAPSDTRGGATRSGPIR
jgi:hypothetical protein